jgi:hypothetical protein
MSKHRIHTELEFSLAGETMTLNACVTFEFTEGCAPHYGNATYPGHPGEGAEYEVLSVAVFENVPGGLPLPCPPWLTTILESLVSKEAMAEQVEFDLQPAEDD